MVCAHAFLVLSFSFIDHGWSNLSTKIQKIGWLPLALVIGSTTFIAGALDGPTDHWYSWIDALWSISVLLILFIGLGKTFSSVERKIPFMTWFSYFAGLLFIITQLYVLEKNDHLSWPWLNAHKETGELVRMLTRPLLLICILSLALTWLGVGGNPLEVENFKSKYSVNDEDLNILKLLAQGESIPEIASKKSKGSKDLHNSVIKKLSNNFELPNEKTICVVLFAIQEGGIDIKTLKLR